VPAAAVTHLVAHGMYKAALFLGSGNAVHASVEHHRLPPAPPRASWPSWPMVIGAAVPAVVLVLGAMAFALPANKWILLVFAWASTTIAASGWLRRRHDGRGVAWFVGSTVVGVGAYLGVVVFVSHLLESSLPAIGGAPGTIGLVLLLLATAGLAVVQALPDRFAELHDRLYVLSLGGVR
jgi:NADH:ubiquinone oxidoreductase subunit 5 (subunit L)/multisubunit Na+/H+ antiporter MnhA subunit